MKTRDEACFHIDFSFLAGRDGDGCRSESWDGGVRSEEAMKQQDDNFSTRLASSPVGFQ